MKIYLQKHIYVFNSGVAFVCDATLLQIKAGAPDFSCFETAKL